MSAGGNFGILKEAHLAKPSDSYKAKAGMTYVYDVKADQWNEYPEWRVKAVRDNIDIYIKCGNDWDPAIEVVSFRRYMNKYYKLFDDEYLKCDFFQYSTQHELTNMLFPLADCDTHATERLKVAYGVFYAPTDSAYKRLFDNFTPSDIVNILCMFSSVQFASINKGLEPHERSNFYDSELGINVRFYPLLEYLSHSVDSNNFEKYRDVVSILAWKVSNVSEFKSLTARDPLCKEFTLTDEYTEVTIDLMPCYGSRGHLESEDHSKIIAALPLFEKAITSVSRYCRWDLMVGGVCSLCMSKLGEDHFAEVNHAKALTTLLKLANNNRLVWFGFVLVMGDGTLKHDKCQMSFEFNKWEWHMSRCLNGGCLRCGARDGRKHQESCKMSDRKAMKPAAREQRVMRHTSHPHMNAKIYEIMRGICLQDNLRFQSVMSASSTQRRFRVSYNIYCSGACPLCLVRLFYESRGSGDKAIKWLHLLEEMGFKRDTLDKMMPGFTAQFSLNSNVTLFQQRFEVYRKRDDYPDSEELELVKHLLYNSPFLS